MRCFVMQLSNTLKCFVRRALPLAGLLAAAASGEAMAGASGKSNPKEAGVWIDDTGKGAVRIEACGGNLCGRIVWLRDPLNAQGQPLRDKNNPDPAKQTRPICGLPTLGQLVPLPEGGYDGGWVYDPKVGKTYDVAITLNGPNELQVTGYKGVRFLGKTFVWTRAKAELAPCDAQPAAAAGSAAGAAPGTAKPGAAKKAAPAGAEPELPWATKPAASGAAKPGTQGAVPKPAAAAKPANAAAKPVTQPAAVKRPEGAAQLGAPKTKPAPTSP